MLVTGGAGFIGSHLVDALVARGHEVLVVDDLSTGRMDQVNALARFYRLDITSQLMDEFFQKEKPQMVFHLAAQINARKSVERPDFDAWVNAWGSVRLVQLALEHNASKFIFASTGGAIYADDAELPATEDAPCKPISPYAITKYFVDQYLAMYGMYHGMDWISLRYANVYGPRQNALGEAGVIAVFSQALAANQQPVIFGDGQQTRDFVYVDDVVSANLAALDLDTSAFDHSERVMNIGTGREASVKQVFDMVAALALQAGSAQGGSAQGGKQIEPVYGDAKPGDKLRSAIDAARAGRLLGWQPAFTLEQGIAKTYEWFAKQG
ncbi:MAG: UDP-glucose 4-epimerase [Parcubacteria group bacterium GW2011_GWA2_47_8]|nr:MAG: UDP-glucose 4-epimerase [Parcubacteria group bacterium GW2011_GWA2_47_8]